MLVFNLALFVSVVVAAKVNPLPAPRNITWENGSSVLINMDSILLQASQQNNILETAFNRSMGSVKELKWYPAAVEAPSPEFPDDLEKRLDSNSTIEVVNVVVNDFAADLQFGVNESYTLSVNDSSININAETVWGALHAFTTLQQLIIYENGNYFIESRVSIWDAPFFGHRGIMIDSGRNFLSIKAILDQIDMLALSKINVLHWHLEDTQSWPVQMESYPEMTKDAYSERKIYTKQQLLAIIEYARERGVRIIPEIEAPGHAKAGWKQINPDLLACEASLWSWAIGQMEILNNDLYEAIGNVYSELSDIFPDHVFHVGADEVSEQCFNFSSRAKDFYKDNNTIHDLAQYYLDHSLPIFQNVTDRRLIMWEDIVVSPAAARDVPKDIIMQSWNNKTGNVDRLTSLGYDVIVSSSEFFYLDCGTGNWLPNDPSYLDLPKNDKFNTGTGGSWCGPYKTWQRIYDYDFTMNLTDTQKKKVLGAELPLFSEQVDTAVLPSKIWPRAAALDESTWSGNRDPETGYLRTTSMTQRIVNFREYLVALGFGPAPLMPQFCFQNPHVCDSSHNQTILSDFGADDDFS